MAVKIRQIHQRPGQRASSPRRPPAPRPHRTPPLEFTDIVLSILIPTVPDREAKLAALLASLDAQVAGRTDVELLVLRDNRSMSIGEKRNKMLQLARGDFVAFVDDDDAVAPDYVASICDRLRQDTPDVLCFTVAVRGYGPEKPCRYHPSFSHVTLPTEYRRKPNHLMVWRRDIALRVPFPAIRTGEDTAWAEQISAHANAVSTIDRTLYTYQFDHNDNSMTPR